jgi:hypothetical protein
MYRVGCFGHFAQRSLFTLKLLQPRECFHAKTRCRPVHQCCRVNLGRLATG